MNYDALTVEELVERLGGRSVKGDANIQIKGIAELTSATAEDLCFVRTKRHWVEAGSPQPAAILIPEGIEIEGPVLIFSENPSLDFARAARLFASPRQFPNGIHASAVLHDNVTLGEDISIGAGAVIGANCRIGDHSIIWPNVTLYDGVKIGSNCEIHSSCTLREDVILGDRVTLHPGVVLGADGFGYEFAEDGRLEKVPQIGTVKVGDETEIGANTTVDRARVGVTSIGARCKIDNLVQIAHNCQIGDDCVVVAQTGLAGGVRLGSRVAVMAQAGLDGSARVGDGAIIGARAGVMGEVGPGKRMFGIPAVEGKGWLRSVSLSARLPEFLKRIRALEKRVFGDKGSE